ncbi:thioredoxin domain-containing protein [Candidatus Roizmanbacteria bacterium]|nr:thioredoxin domain-containing protein [Candidatus Roizmanbacteria bacterium]
MKKVLYIATSLVLLFGFLFIVYSFTNKPSVITYSEVNVIKPDDHLKWSSAKKDILVEYSDYQCPGCANFHKLIQTLEKSPDGAKIMQNVTFVYRNFPLTQIHRNSLSAAYLGEAAGKQGKFFEMGDVLFDKQSEWAEAEDPQPLFMRYAQSLGLNIDQLKTDMNSQEVKDKVQKDQASGTNASLDKTPTFYLNGKKIDPQSFDDFKTTLEQSYQ